MFIAHKIAAMMFVTSMILLIVLISVKCITCANEYIFDCPRVKNQDCDYDVMFFCHDQFKEMNYFDRQHTIDCSDDDSQPVLTYFVYGIHFNDCQISEISVDIFTSYSYLRTLNISSMQLEHMSSGLFRGSKNLRKIIASHNRLSVIRTDQFVLAKDILLSVDLSFNNIDKIEKGAFNGPLTHFSSLDISHNNIHRIPFDAFHNMGALRHLDLSHNQMKSIEIGTFAHQRRLKTLDLAFNMITVVDLGRALPQLGWIEDFILFGNPLNSVSGWNPQLFPHLKWSENFAIASPPPKDDVMDKITAIARDAEQLLNHDTNTVESSEIIIVWITAFGSISSVMMLIVFVLLFVRQSRHLQSSQSQLKSIWSRWRENELGGW